MGLNDDFNKHLAEDASESINVMYLPPPYTSAVSGSSNNEAAFNNAISLAGSKSGCGVVYIPPGNFWISESINIDTVKPIKFIGAGRGLSIINDTRTTGTISIIVTIDGCYLSDFTLTGNQSQLYGIEISNVYGKGTVIERVIVGDPYDHTRRLGFGNETNNGAGICITTSRYVRIRDCIIGDNYHGIKLTATSTQEPNVCSIYSCDIEHNAFSGIYCNGIASAPAVFGGTLQYNGLYGVYSVVTKQQIKLHEVYLEQNGFYVEGGYNAVLHFSHLGHALGNGLNHIVKNVQDVSIQGVRGNTAQTAYSGAERIYFDTHCSNVRYEGLETVSQNMLKNGNFEDSPANTGWSSARVTLTTQLSDIIEGTQALKLTANDTTGSGTSYLSQSIINYLDYAGKQVTVGAWVKALSTNTNTSYIQIWSKSGVMTQLQIPKDNLWHFLTVSHYVDPHPTGLNLYLFVKSTATADTDDVLYVDDVVMGVGKNNFIRFPVRSSYIA